MKKLSVVVLVLLLVSMVSYGENGWTDDGSKVRLTTSSDKVGVGVTNPNSKLHVQWSAAGPTEEENRSAIYGYNTKTDSYYEDNSIGVYGRVKTSNGMALFGKSENSNGYGGYFVGKGYFSGNVGIGTDDPTEQLHVAGNSIITGKVGIGTTDPEKKLEVNGDIKIPLNNRMYFGSASIQGYQAGYGGLKFYGIGGGFDRLAITVDPSGRVGIGTDDPTEQLHVQGNSVITGNVGIGTDDPDEKLEVEGGDVQIYRTDADARLIINTEDSDCYPKLYLRNTDNKYGIIAGAQGVLIRGNDNDGEKGLFVQKISGNVGIGTINPGNYKLAVNGHIRTKEITVESNWSDFVFADNYKLMPLDKLEKHIKSNKSLPGIPKEEVVLKSGIKVGEMQAKLLEKIEELTLYVIGLKKENEELRKANGSLEKRISALEN